MSTGAKDLLPFCGWEDCWSLMESREPLNWRFWRFAEGSSARPRAFPTAVRAYQWCDPAGTGQTQPPVWHTPELCIWLPALAWKSPSWQRGNRHVSLSTSAPRCAQPKLIASLAILQLELSTVIPAHPWAPPLGHCPAHFMAKHPKSASLQWEELWKSQGNGAESLEQCVSQLQGRLRCFKSRAGTSAQSWFCSQVALICKHFTQTGSYFKASYNNFVIHATEGWDDPKMQWIISSEQQALRRLFSSMEYYNAAVCHGLDPGRDLLGNHANSEVAAKLDERLTAGCREELGESDTNPAEMDLGVS